MSEKYELFQWIYYADKQFSNLIHFDALFIIWKHTSITLIWFITRAFRIRTGKFSSKSVKIKWNFIRLMAAMLKKGT